MIDEGDIRSTHVNALLENFHNSKPADLNDRVDEQNQFLFYKNLANIGWVLTVGVTVILMVYFQRPLIALAGIFVLLALHLAKKQIEKRRQEHYMGVTNTWIHDAFIKMPKLPHTDANASLEREVLLHAHNKNMEYVFNTLTHHAEKTAKRRPLDEYLSEVQDYIISNTTLHKKLDRAYGTARSEAA
ncbi:MAG: hypothetical protein DI628_05775 [Blastochloris viridis]|uniref:Uncharacterized protein n=1 Tax=Blastochloris viridis TaxID=1079 RepID=A0A6N4RAX8_BLAVI|nr:MAG: hypothetical protein DI628_05775 [Blastochloris viridis]